MSEIHATFLASPRPEQNSVLVFVVERIKEALIKKELKAGDELPSEAELAKNLGVSKTTVREAIKMLQAIGIVEVRRGQRSRIREYPEEDLIKPMLFQLILEYGTTKHLLDFRMMFETAFTLMAMEQATEDDITRIETLLRDFESSLARGLPMAQYDLAFHYAILESTHNPYVIRTGRTILQLFKASIGKSAQEHPEVALADHQEIFQAFRQKDAVRLRSVVNKSFEGWKRTLEEVEQP